MNGANDGGGAAGPLRQCSDERSPVAVAVDQVERAVGQCRAQITCRTAYARAGKVLVGDTGARRGRRHRAGQGREDGGIELAQSSPAQRDQLSLGAAVHVAGDQHGYAWQLSWEGVRHGVGSGNCVHNSCSARMLS